MTIKAFIRFSFSWSLYWFLGFSSACACTCKLSANVCIESNFLADVPVVLVDAYSSASINGKAASISKHGVL